MIMSELIIKDNYELNEDNDGSFTNKNSNQNKNAERTSKLLKIIIKR